MIEVFVVNRNELVVGSARQIGKEMTDKVDDVVSGSCSVCAYETDVDNLITTSDGDVVCDECTQICYRCDTIGSSNDDFHTVDNDTWCDACTDRRAYWCESCEEYNSSGTSYVSDRQEHWCECCLDSAYWCEDCDEYNADGCDNCADNLDDSGNRIIHDYSYRPDAIFHSTDSNERLFFGIEIEVEAGQRLRDAATYARQLEDIDLAYLKHDGSLNSGFEIVTHPMSHEFYKTEATELWAVLEQLRSNPTLKVRSWDTSTCGLHIHISRTGFNGGAHMHRFLNLIYSNREFYSILAGRESDQWAKFDDIYQREIIRDSEGNAMRDEWDFVQTRTTRQFKHKLDNNRGSDRYSAVNTNNHATLEMRIFKGTVNGDTIKAQLDLAHASVEYTRTLSVSDITQGALTSDNFMWYIFEHESQYPELVARIDKLITPTLPVGLARQNVSI